LQFVHLLKRALLLRLLPLAQPLVLSSFQMQDNSVHDIVVVATETNDVYAIDPNSTETLWHVNLGTPQDGDHLNARRSTRRSDREGTYAS